VLSLDLFGSEAETTPLPATVRHLARRLRAVSTGIPSTLPARAPRAAGPVSEPELA
jgi:hypothetical protein